MGLADKFAKNTTIERPASIIKELVENSLNSGASIIDVNIKKAGKTGIVVRDNGCGIKKNDLAIILSRYPTGKIDNIEDLFTLESLSFRGEVLYNIRAVSDITLRSRTADNDIGWEIHSRDQEDSKIKPINMPQGTEVEIKELFFNAPALKKNLKTDTVELAQILNSYLPYTLLYPGRQFSLTHYDKKILDLPQSGNYADRACRALNLNPEYVLITEKKFPQEKISIRIILGNVNIQRSRKDLQFIFVNNRPAINRFFAFHLNQIYKLIMPAQAYPFFCLYLTVPKENIDINIHSIRNEVKIKDERFFAPLLRSMAECALLNNGKIKQLHKFSLYPSADYEPTSNVLSRPSSFQRTAADDAMYIPRQNSLMEKLSTARYIGQFLKKYLFFETPSSLLVIDQRAGQERIVYEQFKHQIETAKIEVQTLLMPLIVRLVPRELSIWKEVKDTLQKLGFFTSFWNEENIAIQAYPLLIKNPEIAVRNLLDEESIIQQNSNDLIRRICHNSSIIDYEISNQQAESLRQTLLKCSSPFTCPYGQPVIIEILDKTFNRNFSC